MAHHYNFRTTLSDCTAAAKAFDYSSCPASTIVDHIMKADEVQISLVDEKQNALKASIWSRGMTATLQIPTSYN